MDFDWDDANRLHIEAHGIEPDEAEDAILDDHALDFPAHRGPCGQSRTGILGRAWTGRVLVVILEERAEGLRVVTARIATLQREATMTEKPVIDSPADLPENLSEAEAQTFWQTHEVGPNLLSASEALDPGIQDKLTRLRHEKRQQRTLEAPCSPVPSSAA